MNELFKRGSPDQHTVISMVERQIQSWVKSGYPFTLPQLRSYSLDFSASTENSTSQGYWSTLDSEREDEVLLHLKLPPGIDGTRQEGSPYNSKNLTFRFFVWFPRAAASDWKKSDQTGNIHPADRGSGSLYDLQQDESQQAWGK